MASAAAKKEQSDVWLRTLLDATALEPFAEVTVITPDMARALMGQNVENRNLSRGLVKQIADDIKAGRWQFNGETIIVAKSGELNDGQHRLQAIIEAAIPVQLVLVGGVPRESRMTLDMGKSRGIYDYLHLMGVRNPNVVASVARLAIAYEQSASKNFEPARWVSKAAGMDRGLKDKAIHEACAWAASGHGHQMAYLTPPSPAGFCYYLLKKIGGDHGVEFMDRLADGANQPKHSPILTCRRYLPTFAPRHREGKMALIFRAWNLWIRGEDGTPDNIHGRYPLPKLLKPTAPTAK